LAQFDVYKNKNARTRSTFPFLVDVQSDLLDPLSTRVVVPLTKVAALARKPVSHVTPTVMFDAEAYVLIAPQLAGIAKSELGSRAGTLASEREKIMGAIDFVLTGFSAARIGLAAPAVPL
jgi:toxin CcdB